MWLSSLLENDLTLSFKFYLKSFFTYTVYQSSLFGNVISRNVIICSKDEEVLNCKSFDAWKVFLGKKWNPPVLFELVSMRKSSTCKSMTSIWISFGKPSTNVQIEIWKFHFCLWFQIRTIPEPILSDWSNAQMSFVNRVF